MSSSSSAPPPTSSSSPATSPGEPVESEEATTGPPPLETLVTLRDGTRVRIRPVTRDDAPRLEEGLRRLSPRSRYLRFLRAIERLTRSELARLTDLDYVDRFAIGAEAADDPGSPGLGIARYERLPDDPEVAEAAVAVLDEHQGKGLGTALVRALAEIAYANGVRRFRAYVLPENTTVIRMLTDAGAEIVDRQPGLWVFEVPLPPPGKVWEETRLHEALRAVARRGPFEADDLEAGDREAGDPQEGSTSEGPTLG